MMGENNTEYDFYATASIPLPTMPFVIDFTGAVSIIHTGEGGSDNSPEEEKDKKGKERKKVRVVVKWRKATSKKDWEKSQGRL